MSQTQLSMAEISLEIFNILIQENDAINLQKMIGSDLPFLTTDSQGSNLLHHACQLGNLSCIKILLDNNVPINQLNHDQQTPLHIAIQARYWPSVELLLQHGDAQTQQYAKQCLADKIHLYKAAKHGFSNIAKVLIDLNHNVNGLSSYDNTALHYAAKNNQIDLLAYLIKHRADLNLQNIFRETALHLAIKKGYVTAVHLLLKNHANIFIKNDIGQSSYRLGLASENSQIRELVKQTFQKRLRESNSKFFNIERTRNPDVHTLGREFHETMQGHQDRCIDVPALPLRSIITAHMMPYRRALYLIDGDMSFFADSKRKDTLMAETFDWSNDGMDEKFEASSAWARFNIYIFGTPIKFQVKPLSSQIANLFIAGVNSYGREKENDILFMIDYFVHSSKEAKKRLKEKTLAQLILHTLHSGEPISKQSLIDAHILKRVNHKKVSKESPRSLLAKKDKEQTEYVHRLNKFIYLIGVIETHRRLYPFLDSTQNKVIPELPMGIAVAMALKLISINALNFEQVFSKDAKNFGPFTDDQINSIKGVELFNQKISALVELYYQHFPKQEFTQESMHTLLKETFGGEEDTDGEEYLSDDGSPIVGYDEAYTQKQTCLSQTHLHRAVITDDIQKVRKLLVSPIDIDAQDYQDKTALHYAVENNYVDIVRLLLEYGADPNIFDNSGNYPLFYAMDKDLILVIELLKLHHASEQQRNDVDGEFVHYVDKYGESVLHNAVSMADKPIFYKVLNHLRLDIDFKNSHGQTALHLAAVHHQIEFAKVLLKKHANPCAIDHSYKTPLYYAKKNKHKRITKLLTSNGATVEALRDEENLDLTSSEHTNTSVSSSI
jgi:ankyrin repeat protein